MPRLLALLLLAALVGATQARPADELSAETEDWIFVAPGALGTQADLELVGRSIQICSDEIERLIGYRPRNVARFTARW